MPGAAGTFGFLWGTSATRSDVKLPLEMLVAGGPEWDCMLTSLFRAAEAKWFDRSYRLTGSEKQQSRPELPLDRHRLGTLPGLLDAHFVAVADKGISGDVRRQRPVSIRSIRTAIASVTAIHEAGAVTCHVII
jgi:hypothetical protein